MAPAANQHDQRIAADMAAINARQPVAWSAPPTCETCRGFIHDDINPGAGMGSCRAGHPCPFPGQRRHCADYHAIK